MYIAVERHVEVMVSQHDISLFSAGTLFLNRTEVFQVKTFLFWLAGSQMNPLNNAVDRNVETSESPNTN